MTVFPDITTKIKLGIERVQACTR